MTKIKLCGFSKIEDIAVVNETGPDDIGFVFAKSKRQVSKEQAARMKADLKDGILAFGVFVNEKKETIAEYLEEGIIDVAQLHGEESAEEIRYLKEKTGKMIVKAISIQAEERIPERNRELLKRKTQEQWSQNGNSIEGWKEDLAIKKEILEKMKASMDAGADFLLLDAYSADAWGGTGKTFQWELLKEVPYPYFLAGGLNEKTLEEAVCFFQNHPEIPAPLGYDLSSGIETDGKKDAGKIRSLMKKWKILASKSEE